MNIKKSFLAWLNEEKKQNRSSVVLSKIKADITPHLSTNLKKKKNGTGLTVQSVTIGGLKDDFRHESVEEILDKFGDSEKTVTVILKTEPNEHVLKSSIEEDNYRRFNIYKSKNTRRKDLRTFFNLADDSLRANLGNIKQIVKLRVANPQNDNEEQKYDTLLIVAVLESK